MRNDREDDLPKTLEDELTNDLMWTATAHKNVSFHVSSKILNQK